MTNYECATWIRGFLQLCPQMALNKRKVQILKNHLNLAAAVDGGLGEKNQLVYTTLTSLDSVPTEEQYADFKNFLMAVYFENTEAPAA